MPVWVLCCVGLLELLSYCASRYQRQDATLLVERKRASHYATETAGFG